MLRLSRYLALAAFLLTLSAILACGGDEEEGSTDDPSATGSSGNRASPTEILPIVSPTPKPTLSAACAQAAQSAPTATPPEVQVKQYTSKPEMTIDTTKTYLAHVYTEKGHIVLNLLPNLAPEHVNSFVFLAKDNYFDGQTFHRVVKSPQPFVAQTGDPTGTGSGGPGYTLPAEFSQTPFDRGVVGAARTNDPNSAGSQWFITLGPAPHLNGGYTVFAQVAAGMEVADCIEQGDRIVELTVEEL
jgi:peptidylprolyl isomerase